MPRCAQPSQAPAQGSRCWFLSAPRLSAAVTAGHSTSARAFGPLDVLTPASPEEEYWQACSRGRTTTSASAPAIRENRRPLTWMKEHACAYRRRSEAAALVRTMLSSRRRQGPDEIVLRHGGIPGVEVVRGDGSTWMVEGASPPRSCGTQARSTAWAARSCVAAAGGFYRTWDGCARPGTVPADHLHRAREPYNRGKCSSCCSARDQR